MKPRKWTESQLQEAAQKSSSIRQILRALGLVEAGGNYAQIKKYLLFYNVDTSHLKGRGWSKGLVGIGRPRVPMEEILVQNSNFQSYKLKNRLQSLGLKPTHCEECGWNKQTEDGYLPLEIHHMNGDPRDNRLENLLVLCPNCHSLKPNHRGRKKKVV